MDQADQMAPLTSRTACRWPGAPLCVEGWARVWRGPSSRTRRRRGYGHGLAALPAGVSAVIRPWAWYRIVLGDESPDGGRGGRGGRRGLPAGRTFEAGLDRGVLYASSKTRLAVMHPVRPWRARAFGPCARLLRLAPQDAPQELRSPRSLRGKQRKPCVAERAAVLHGGKPPLPCSGWAAAVG